MKDAYLTSVRKQFLYYKQLGEKAMDQVSDKNLFETFGPTGNSIAIIVKHLWGNMLSRWTDFLTTDGEKEWRDRDSEFLNSMNTREEVLKMWEAGWSCLMQALDSINDNDLQRIVYIRNEGHTIMEAIHRQLAHYPYHVGQIIFAAKIFSGNSWESLSIPVGKSKEFNAEKFSNPKTRHHFTDDYLTSPEKD